MAAPAAPVAGVTTLARLVAQVRDDATQRLWDALYELLTAKQGAVLEHVLDDLTAPQAATLQAVAKSTPGRAPRCRG